MFPKNVKPSLRKGEPINDEDLFRRLKLIYDFCYNERNEKNWRRIMEDRIELRFIGKEGSMGLHHRRIYKCKIFVGYSFIWVDWRKDRCPYPTLETLCENWESM